jgi:type VI secretion system protein ImpM
VTAATAPGWHGKLPALGDFASRRLPPDFVAAWDEWLSAGLAALQDADGAGWLDAYLASPSWRFWLQPGALPGACGRHGWAGVLMPSVDRVGRYFPFTAVLPLPAAPATAQQMAALWHWLGRLDELAADAMHDDWSVDRLEDELARMALPAFDAVEAGGDELPVAPGAIVERRLGDGADAPTIIGAEAQATWCARASGLAHWYESTELGGRRLLVSRGLPMPASMRSLLGATIPSR